MFSKVKLKALDGTLEVSFRWNNSLKISIKLWDSFKHNRPVITLFTTYGTTSNVTTTWRYCSSCVITGKHNKAAITARGVTTLRRSSCKKCISKQRLTRILNLITVEYYNVLVRMVVIIFRSAFIPNWKKAQSAKVAM